MSMKVLVHDCETGETYERDMTPEEIEEYEARTANPDIPTT